MLQGKMNREGGAGEGDTNKPESLHFVILKLQNPFDAISAEMYKRAMGASQFCASFLHLINCAERYNEFVSDILKDSNCTVVRHRSVKEFTEYAKRREGDEFYVVDAWPTRILVAKRLKEVNKRVILIEDYPISFERFNSNKFVNRLLTSSIIYKMRVHRSLKIFRTVDYVVSNSEVTHNFLRIRWSFTASFVSYVPILSHVFRYNTGSNRDSIVIHCPSDLDAADMSNITSASKCFDFKRIYLLNPTKECSSSLESFNDRIVVKRNYSFDEIRDIYSQCYLSVIPERAGTLEGPPIESISSGVPILGNRVSSIDVIDGLLLKSGIHEKPFYSLENFDHMHFREWLTGIQGQMGNISEIVNSYFSPETIMADFIKNISFST
jgi:hypothetical protein